MPVSQNGWPASPDPAAINVKPFEVAGRSFPGGVKGGSVATVLRYVVAAYHTRVESLYFGDTDRDDWGYNYRDVRGGSLLSNHASATAVDVNATTNPRGVAHSHTWAQEQEIRRILKEAGGVVTWGRDFPTPDAMHFEIREGASSTQVAAVAKRLLSPSWFTRDLKAGMSGEDVKVVQRRLKVTVTGRMDARTVQAVNLLRRRLQFAENGLVNKALAFYIGSPA